VAAAEKAKIAIRSALPAKLPSCAGLLSLVSADCHPLAAKRERTTLIIGRVRQIAGLFVVLTLAWIAVDALSMAWPLWGALALDRIVASLAFAYLVIHPFDLGSTRAAYTALGGLIAVPLVFYLLAIGLLDQAGADSSSLAGITAYYFLPMIVAAGLSIFPLTALEAVAFGIPILAAMAIASALWPSLLGSQSALATMWRLALITGISTLAGISQLRFLLMLTEQATRDGLTGLLTRRVGEEILEQQFSFAARHDIPLTILFLDLDNFKKINDRFGHEAGDDVLRAAAAKLRQALRHQDVLVRWGGEEFLIALPDTDAANAEATVRRIALSGIGQSPDGDPVTASIGIAERKIDARDQALDQTQDQKQAIIALADKRMYAAKLAGRNRYCFRDEPHVWCRSELSPKSAGAPQPRQPPSPIKAREVARIPADARVDRTRQSETALG
jgi:diguanylate cyclase (GGDEF)-like protein